MTVFRASGMNGPVTRLQKGRVNFRLYEHQAGQNGLTTSLNKDVSIVQEIGSADGECASGRTNRSSLFGDRQGGLDVSICGRLKPLSMPTSGQEMVSLAKRAIWSTDST